MVAELSVDLWLDVGAECDTRPLCFAPDFDILSSAESYNRTTSSHLLLNCSEPCV
jgi:hypothetical protein